MVEPVAFGFNEETAGRTIISSSGQLRQVKQYKLVP